MLILMCSIHASPKLVTLYYSKRLLELHTKPDLVG